MLPLSSGGLTRTVLDYVNDPKAIDDAANCCPLAESLNARAPTWRWTADNSAAYLQNAAVGLGALGPQA
ncbi:hypothetical protein MHPYR_490026 [uncultured Mycobacterium sp.]|uniref:Uncharacterized protein n=1 Tax=uncultured Mycobacterium sp. TaxID=171292 RepID=A0A1Y5PGN2_9MYCO|nr:hypothetical protein MHPYR_490026 [uncultured Mycobacterium sp.]